MLHQGALRISPFDSIAPTVFLRHFHSGVFTGEGTGSLSFAAGKLDTQQAVISACTWYSGGVPARVCACVGVGVCVCVHTCTFEGMCSLPWGTGGA